MTILVTALELFVGLSLLVVAAGVLFRLPAARIMLDPPPASRLARTIIAAITTLPAIGMIVAVMVPFIAFFAAAVSVFVVGAYAGTNGLTRRRGGVIASAALAFAALGVALLQPLGLHVLALPKADTLPYTPVAARVIKTYEPGTWFESVRAAPDGTLYLAFNRDLDFTETPYY